MTASDMDVDSGYTARLAALLDRLVRTQSEALDRVAAASADALMRGNLVHFFGSGHSVIPVLDAFPRYGSFVGLHPLTDPRLMWHNVLGPGGSRELQWLERSEGYIETFLAHEPLTAGDLLICYSHGGTNAAPIEAAMYAARLGVTTVAVTAAGTATPVRHSSGRRLTDVCDLVVDTCCPIEDAIVPVPGWPRPTGGAATVLQIVVTQEIITRTAKVVAARGCVLPTLASPTVPGVTLATNDEVFAEHRRYLHEARGRALAAEPLER
ncbi:sugar isomerase domain-containing protein [Dactylosporangium matsuzakiense]|uniref:UPF0309 protein n=1 Tax=Dactylosporangium matsuzakiense TaxID=53360 RepID=A0A9W6NME3_9ACTN|nr:sugar isomerase domain-containing protein [Dactylosporangium matsuzakiense]GLL02111.1 UPF0309 protein [Dactylosporangium matsuzakiense]